MPDTSRAGASFCIFKKLLKTLLSSSSPNLHSSYSFLSSSCYLLFLSCTCIDTVLHSHPLLAWRMYSQCLLSHCGLFLWCSLNVSVDKSICWVTKCKCNAVPPENKSNNNKKRLPCTSAKEAYAAQMGKQKPQPLLYRHWGDGLDESSERRTTQVHNLGALSEGLQRFSSHFFCMWRGEHLQMTLLVFFMRFYYPSIHYLACPVP